MNSFARSLIGLAALAGAAAFAPVAQAATTPLTFDDGTANFTTILTHTPSTADFSFTLGEASAGDLLLSANTKNAFVLSNLTLTGPGGVAYVATPLSVSTNSYEYTWSGLVAGLYKLAITGYSSSAKGSSSVTGQLSVSAVPLPGALVLFGSGIVALGAVARRKRRNSAR